MGESRKFRTSRQRRLVACSPAAATHRYDSYFGILIRNRQLHSSINTKFHKDAEVLLFFLRKDSDELGRHIVFIVRNRLITFLLLVSLDHERHAIFIRDFIQIILP
jgi:hypothetical protein